jgi:hypothetical protein
VEQLHYIPGHHTCYTASKTEVTVWPTMWPGLLGRVRAGQSRVGQGRGASRLALLPSLDPPIKAGGGLPLSRKPYPQGDGTKCLVQQART